VTLSGCTVTNSVANETCTRIATLDASSKPARIAEFRLNSAPAAAKIFMAVKLNRGVYSSRSKTAILDLAADFASRHLLNMYNNTLYFVDGIVLASLI
jgi:hypothetical protein